MKLFDLLDELKKGVRLTRNGWEGGFIQAMGEAHDLDGEDISDGNIYASCDGSDIDFENATVEDEYALTLDDLSNDSWRIRESVRLSEMEAKYIASLYKIYHLDFEGSPFLRICEKELLILSSPTDLVFGIRRKFFPDEDMFNQGDITFALEEAVVCPTSSEQSKPLLDYLKELLERSI